MTYVVQTRTWKEGDRYRYSDHLMEMTPAEARKAEASEEPGIEYNIVNAATAHKMVRRDCIHSTGLWIDDQGRMRKAKEGC